MEEGGLSLRYHKFRVVKKSDPFSPIGWLKKKKKKVGILWLKEI